MRIPKPADFGLSSEDLFRGDQMERERPGVFTDLRFHTNKEIFGYLSGRDRLMCYKFAYNNFVKKELRE